MKSICVHVRSGWIDDDDNDDGTYIGRDDRAVPVSVVLFDSDSSLRSDDENMNVSEK